MGTPGDTARAGDERAPRRAREHALCDLYVPGHLLHPIQAKKAWESDDPVRWGRFEGVDGNWLVVRFLDGPGRYRFHRPAEVARVAEVGDKVRVSERWGVASISRRFEHVLTVCIGLPDHPWRPCSVAPAEPGSLDDLAERLEDRGGFVGPGQVVTQLVGQADRTEGGDEAPPEGTDTLDDVS